MNKALKRQNFLKAFGPGIVFAATAIGVSHLVQSSRAGADYGYTLLWAVILANLFKYPFFEYGARYANVMGESLLDGYLRMSKWYLYLYLFVTIGSMFTLTAAVSFLTAGLFNNLLGITIPISQTAAILFIICITVLLIGRYKLLDSLIKVIGFVLLISTLFAFVMVWFKDTPERIEGFVQESVWSSDKGILFLIALMGWMPTGIELSPWSSLWTIERIKETGYKPTLKESILDFRIGYILSAILAICFLVLGAKLINGTGVALPDNAVAFSSKIVSMYTYLLGDWTYYIIAIAAFSIMFSTTITVFDGYSRVFERTTELLFFKKIKSNTIYIFSLLLVGVGGYIIIAVFIKDLLTLIDLATTISFVIAPIIAFLNFRLLTRSFVPIEGQPGFKLKILSIFGILFLVGFMLVYVKIVVS